jgi:hypothetical protein
MKQIDAAVQAAHQWVVDSTGISHGALATACWYALVAVGALMVVGVSKFGLWGDPGFVFMAVYAFVLLPLALFLAQRLPPAIHHSPVATAVRLFTLAALAIEIVRWAFDANSDGVPVITLMVPLAVAHLYFCACDPPRPRRRRNSGAAIAAAP